MADLYLMKAEALTQYIDAPTQEVYDAIKMCIRDRVVDTLGETLSKPPMVDII